MRRAIIVTGASRGFGRAIAASVAKSLVKPSHFVLAGTSEEELRKTEEIVKSTPKDGIEATTELVLEDLSRTSHLSDVASKLFDSIAASSDIDDIVFFNNAGSLGPLAPVGAEAHTLSSVATAFDVNVTASCYLTSEMIRRLSSPSYAPQAKTITIVNISSLAAVQAFESWSVYCAGKAARDMYHKVLAEEQKKSPCRENCRVLNYAPGPLDTNMQKEIRENPLVDKPTQEYFVQMKENNQLVSPDASADKLVALLSSGSFDSGAHVDYFEI